MDGIFIRASCASVTVSIYALTVMRSFAPNITERTNATCTE
jgi:hypothetical protein